MSTKRGGLGRNLSALLGQAERAVERQSGDTTRMTLLPVHDLQPGQYQPRRDFDENALAELAESIKKQGLLQPLIVRKLLTGRYEIIAGERRWRACQLADLSEIAVIVRQVDDETAMAMALVENLQREDLNAMDQARAMQRLTEEFSLTHQQIAELLGKSRTAVSNYLRLLNLNADVSRMLEHGDLEMGHARCLIMLDHEQQTQIAHVIIAKNLSVRETEAMVTRLKNKKPSMATQTEEMPLFQEQLQTLAQQLQTKINLKQGKAGQGSLVIHYNNPQNLEKMINLLLV